ncbi:MAG: cytochrome ubiquinol oxidase subunit I [Candidatus Neomarinimicrobiota bacterium]
MNYPIWQVPLIGGGLLIGAIAILHVFISHFAIGGGLFLVLTEMHAIRTGDEVLRDYLKSHARFFILVTLVLGALSGVGIWFTISLVNPEATGLLIRTFVWAWATEWVFFLVEILAAFIYYYTWDTLDARRHVAVGWVYFIAAWLSLFFINGILTFMLTPGRWLETGSFWPALFNPGFGPSLLIRTGVAFSLAGLYALLTSSFIKEGIDRSRLVRYSAKWLMPAVLLIPLGGIWYINVLPESARHIFMGGAPAVTMFAIFSVVVSILIFAFIYFLPYRSPAAFTPALAILFMILGFSVTAVTEWTREAVRKPYIIYDFMYSNNFTKTDGTRYTETGVLPAAKWLNPHEEQNPGYKLYQIQCASCHTPTGYNGLKQLTYGWSEPYLESQLDHLDELKEFMPPFIGTAAERHLLARWLVQLHDGGNTDE